MLSEERLRADVQQIANSIDVDTDAHLAAVMGQPPADGRPTTAGGDETSRRKRLVPLAAAAAIVGVVVAGAVVTKAITGGDPATGKPVPTVLTGTPDGTVPSVFGHTRDTATALLQRLGYDVEYGEEISCDPAGRPVGTEPPPGTPVEPGGSITVLLSYQGAATDCMADLREPWRFMDFATGRGTAPSFADEVDLFVDGERAGTMSGADAAQGDWGPGSALRILNRASEQVLRVGDSYQLPQLQVTAGTPPDSWCGVERPPSVADREALTLTIDFADDAGGEQCPARVALYERAGAIDTVVAWSQGGPGSNVEPIPDVVGLPLTKARNAVTGAGYPVRVEEMQTCDPRRGVVEQAPTQQDIEDDREDDPGWYGPVTLVIEVPHRTRDCAGLDAAASAFVDFARGGTPPAWAPEVQQLFGYAPWDTITSAAADDRAAWSFCSGVAPEDCEVSPLVVAARDGEIETGEFSDVSRYPDDQVCESIDLGGLPDGLPVEKQIVIYPAEISSCDDDWSVWLWIDDEGRIATVNLLVPREAAEG